MFIDASALTAIFAGEEDAAEFSARVERAPQRLTSPLAVWEAAVALTRISGIEPALVSRRLQDDLADAGIEIAPVPPAAAAIALDAFDRFGKGRYPAGLNFGDCFAYACARCHDLPLLYKGGDFALTDIASA